MTNAREAIHEQLNSLRGITSSDFSALAAFALDGRHTSWKYAVGSVNERYKRILGKPRNGIAGSVIRYGRAVVWDENDPEIDSRRLEDPIMLAENLYAVSAVPVTMNGTICGVIVAGSRSMRAYGPEDVQAMVKAARSIAPLQREAYSEW